MYTKVLTCVVFLAIFDVTYSVLNAAGVPCGRTQLRKSRVKNGKIASEGEFPWLVSIRFGTDFDSNHICGGTLIHKRFILTAAHCMQQKHLAYINIMVSEHDSTVQSKNEKMVTIKKVHMHEQYEKRYINDIALLELTQEVAWSAHARPICLPDESTTSINNLDNKMMMVAGWGYTDEQSNGGSPSSLLKKASIPIVPIGKCQKWYDTAVDKQPTKTQRITLFDTVHLCAGYDKGHIDACQGDSGGPLMMVDGKGRWTVMGVVSSGIGCGRAQIPGIYTKVQFFVPWIKNILNHAGITLHTS